MSNAVELRPVAITDLSVRYARDLGNNKVRHYRVSHALSMLGKDPCREIQRYIEKEEGPCSVTFSYPTPGANNGTTLKTIDAVSILQNEKAIKKALLKKSIKSQIYQWTEYKITERLFNLIVRPGNFLIRQVNKALMVLQSSKVNYNKKLYEDNKDLYEQGYFVEGYKEIKQIMPLQYKGDRRLEACRYLSVSFEESDAEAAAKAMVEDLRILYAKGLLVGNLCMPTMIKLADEVGLGKNHYALFSFIFIDTKKACKLLGRTILELNDRTLLTDLGCHYETLEGGTNWLDGVSPSQKYSIETVDVVTTTEENRNAVIESYNASRKAIEEFDRAEMKKALDSGWVPETKKTDSTGDNNNS